MLKSQFHTCKMKRNTDPNQWITSLESIRARIIEQGNDIPELEFKEHIAANLGLDYAHEAKQWLQIGLHRISIQRIRSDLQVQYDMLSMYRNRFVKQNEKSDDDDEKHEETALAAGGGNFKKFKGRCRNCGKYGHKAYHCRDGDNKDNKNNNNNNKNSQDKKYRFQGRCGFCNIYGHEEKDCRHKIKAQSKETANPAAEGANEGVSLICGACDDTQDIAFLNAKSENLENLAIADSGATSHMFQNEEGLYDIREANIYDTVKIGNKGQMKITKFGKKRVEVYDAEGNKYNAVIECAIIPDLWVTLFSLTKVMNSGFEVIGKDDCFTIRKGDFKMVFDQKLSTKKGYLLGARYKILSPPAHAAAAFTMEPGSTMPIKVFHERLGHASEDVTKATAENLGIKLIGKLEVCEDCALAKSRRTPVSKEATNKEEVPGGRLSIDITSIRQESYGGAKFWCMVQDEATKMKWSFFLKNKSDMGSVLVPFLIQLKKQHDVDVKFIRLDNAGENKSFRAECKKCPDLSHIFFEFTAPGTPQQNGGIERSFATLYGKVRAMLNSAGFDETTRGKLWAEAANCATANENVTSPTRGELSSHEKFFGVLPAYVTFMRTFGEIGIVRNVHQGMVWKLENKGIPAMFVGYAQEHAGNVYKMLNLQTHKIILCRDIQWLHKTFGAYHNLSRNQVTKIIELEVPSEKAPVEEEHISVHNNDVQEREGNSESTRLERELRKLDTSYNPVSVFEPTQMTEGMTTRARMAALAFEHIEYGLITPEMAYSGAEDDTVPETFREAWDHPDTTKREQWREAIKGEFSKMNNKKVWRHKNKSEIPQGRTLVSSRWVFVIKKDNTYRARLVARGYTQIPGVDYTENYAPVMQDATLRLLLMLWAKNNLESMVFDVETAFLYGELEEEIFMRVPEGYRECGYKISEDEVLELLMAIYGLIQAARQWWKKFMTLLEDIGFERSLADPCLVKRENKTTGKIIYLGVHVDDASCIGNGTEIKKALEELKTKLTIKELGTFDKYLGCEVIRKDEKVWITQNALIKKLETKFGPKIMHLPIFEVPATAGTCLQRTKDEDEILDEEEHKNFRSGVGILLYLVKNSRPDIANAVRELTKVMDKPNTAHLQALYKTLKYVVDTKNRSICFDTNWKNVESNWELGSYSDSTYASDPDKKVSVTGYIILLEGMLLAWKSRGQKSVTLSSTEAEYVAASETCQEMMAILQIIEFLDIKIKYPMIVRIDNVGAIYLANNQTVNGRTRHVNIRYHFVRQLIEDGTVKVEFVRSKENKADAWTKNLDANLFHKHVDSYVTEFPSK